MPKQKRLTDKEKAEVIADYASGLSKTDIAQKFKVSVTAISKILSNPKSLKNEKKLSEKSLKSQRELRQDIISKATDALYSKDYDELPAETLLKIIERLSMLDKDTPTSDPQDELKAIVDKIKEVTAEEVQNGE